MDNWGVGSSPGILSTWSRIVCDICVPPQFLAFNLELDFAEYMEIPWRNLAFAGLRGEINKMEQLIIACYQTSSLLT